MTDQTSTLSVQSPTYRMAVARFCFHSLNTVCGVVLAALTGVKWATLDGQSKFLLIVGMVAAVSGTAGAFLDKTMARLSDGKAALPLDSTPTPPAPAPSAPAP